MTLVVQLLLCSLDELSEAAPALHLLQILVKATIQFRESLQSRRRGNFTNL